MPTATFKDLIVWKKARDLAVKMYKITESFPKSELYGLTSQMRRAVISIPSNIAESYNRLHSQEKRQFMAIAYASGSELESQIEISKILYPNLNFTEIEKDLLEVQKILNSFINK